MLTRLRLTLASLVGIATTALCVRPAMAATHDWWIVDVSDAVCQYMPNYFNGTENNPLEYENYNRNNAGETFISNKSFSYRDGSEGIEAIGETPQGRTFYVDFFTNLDDCNTFVALAEMQGAITPRSAIQ